MSDQDLLKAHEDYYRHIEGSIGGTERFEWVYANFFKQDHDQKILEIGCGEGSLLALLSRENQVHGVDISSSGVEKTRQKGIPCHLADASNERLPFEDSFFDVVICLETIEHVENPHRMIWEIKRALKENGRLLISIPSYKILHPYIYPGLFSKDNFTEFLKLNSLRVEKVAGWGQAAIFNRLLRSLRERKDWISNRLAEWIYYIGRKRGLLMRKRLGTPLCYAFCLNFMCRNIKKGISRVEEVALSTTPYV